MSIVQAARKYLGVPFRHRGRGPRFLDCVGLVWRAYHDCGVVLPCPDDYGQEPDAQRFRDAIVEALGEPVAGLQAGDVVTLRTALHPHHVAIVGDYYIPGHHTLIHASGEHGRVIEHRLDESYMARIVSIHRRPV